MHALENMELLTIWCVSFISVYAFIHISCVSSLLSRGSGAVHLAIGMYNREARHLSLSLADMTLVLIRFLGLLFFFFAKLCLGVESSIPDKM